MSRPDPDVPGDELAELGEVTVRPASTAAVRGRESGPVQARCEVLTSGHIGSYRSLTLVAPEIAARARPGQFVSIAVGGQGTLLRRPFSLYRVSRSAGGGTIEIVYNTIGEGTRWLAARSRHDVVDVVGPLGNGFPMPQRPDPCLLIGGGYGAAPLLHLATLLRREGNRVDIIFGAATADRLFNAIEAKRVAASATFTTADGSSGVQGLVTDVFDAVVDRAGSRIVYACGPMPMLAAVAQAAAARRLPCQVAVEEAMACGVGVCMTCVVPIHTDDGIRNLRACYEGPVFLGRRVAWDLVGRRIPDEEFLPVDAEPPEQPDAASATGEPGGEGTPA